MKTEMNYEKDDNKRIGKNIKFLRNQEGLNQQDVENAIDIKRESLSAYESGKRPVPALTLSKLSELFGVEPMEILSKSKDEMVLEHSSAFKMKSFDQKDLKSVGEFNKIIKNYIRMVNV